MVYAVDDVDCSGFHWRCDEHCARALVEVTGQVLRRAKRSGGFEHQVDSEFIPRNGSRLRMRGIGDHRVSDVDGIVGGFGLVLQPTAVNGVESQQMGGGLDVAGDLVDVDELEFLSYPAGSKGESSHAAEAVDSDSNRPSHATITIHSPFH
ncbi:MAG TPA: hypothetical protein PKD76_05665 [Solirubrobacterales bacterium]|nr:hypothetical protein [Solirubrobacterales bacterium]